MLPKGHGWVVCSEIETKNELLFLRNSIIVKKEETHLFWSYWITLLIFVTQVG